MTGRVDAVPVGELDQHGSRRIYFFAAAASNTDLSLNDVHLSVEWSEFDACHFRQSVKPITNSHGFAAQGSLGNSPAVYRNCVFERVRFKQLGGFNLGRGWFENCHFINCRWEGHFATNAYLVDCTFAGKMNGCAWFGESNQELNEVRNNDFSAVQFTDNVGWRRSFPVSQQIWPAGYKPQVDL